MAIQYKTRGQSNPKGKPRVCFSCHPADFRVFFPEVTEELLQISNCAIYYYEEEPLQDQEYFLNLSQMQLLVIPVTARLLTTPCRTINVDLPFALEHHIPVLPLIQEPGLDRLFSEKFDSMQYLDRTSRDATAISYRKKLADFLGSVLMGDTLSEKIRDAFSAYIFLSYRKKDRKYAQALMQLIHRNEAFRDIAIWYDEFLVPGEDWSDSIQQAMEKSQVFALTVTPNLVNEENYVMSTEYPMALQANIPIVAAELVPTDPELLCRMYRAYPGSVDPRDQDALFQVLSGHLDCCGNGQTDDPMHQFYIGLAYLSGVDVEIDHSRAVALITAAAEAGLTEAMEKLAAMYRNGEGVRPNRNMELLWLKRLAKKAQRAMLRRPSRETGIQLAVRWKNLGNVQLDSAMLKAAKASFRHSIRILTLIQKCSRRLDNTLLRREHADCYERLSAVYRAEGKIKEASEMIFNSYLAAPYISSDSAPKQDILSRAASTMRLAESWLHDLERAEHAQEHYLHALELLEMLTGRGESSPEIQQCLVRGYLGLGEISAETQQPEKAREWYEKALALQEQLTAELKTPQSRLDLALVGRGLGTLLLAAGEKEACMSRYLAAWEILQELADKLSFSSAIHELVNTCNMLAEISTPGKAENWIATGLSWSTRIYEETGTGTACRDLASTLLKAGALDIDRGNLDQADKKLRKALLLGRELAEQTGEPADQYLLLNIQLKAADLSLARGDIQQAKKQYKKVLSSNERLSEKAYSENNNRIELLGSWKLGEIYLMMGFEDNLENLLNADTLFLDAATNKSHVRPTTEILNAVHGLVHSYCALSEQYLAANSTTDLPLDVDASLCYEEAYRLLLWLYSQTRNPELLSKIRGLCVTLSRLYQASADMYEDDEYLQNVAFWQEKSRAVDKLPETEQIDFDEEFP